MSKIPDHLKDVVTSVETVPLLFGDMLKVTAADERVLLIPLPVLGAYNEELLITSALRRRGMLEEMN